MAINLISKYSNKPAELFHQESVTDSACGHEYSFTGAKTVKIFSIGTAPLNDYTRSGANRYGTPQELEDTVQELTMTQDKSWTYTVDKGNNSDQDAIKNGAACLKRQTREVVVPFMDRYRLLRWSSLANTVIRDATAPTKANIMEKIFDLSSAMDDKKVPRTGRTLFIPNKYFKLLALSDQFIGIDKLGEKSVTKGTVGEIDNMTVKRVPSDYLPEGVYFMIKWQGSSVDPVKLNEAKIHKDPPGLSGNLFEGRVYFDAFVLGAKGDGVGVCGNADAVLAAPTLAIASHKVTVTAENGVVFKYTTDGSNPRYSSTAQTYTAQVTLSSGEVFRCIGTKDGCVGIESQQAYE